MLLDILPLIILLFSMVFHEVAHGFVAYKLGDPTAKYAGRLSLNPLNHLDPIGSFLFPLLTLFLTFGKGPVFGWAKPVPINPYNFKDQRWGELKVSIAGPGVNFLIAIIFGLFLRFFYLPYFVSTAFAIISVYNFFWGIFNLLPVPPLDGSHILLSLLEDRVPQLKLVFEQYGLLLMLLVVFFGLNLIQPLAFRMFYLVAGKIFVF